MDEIFDATTPEVDESMLARMLDSLIETLQTHVENHRQLLTVMERKKDACVEVQIDGLDSIVKEEQVVIEAICSSEEDRIASLREIEGALGYKGPHRIRLLDLINRVGESYRLPLLELRDELREIADSMDRLNRLNRALVLHSLEQVHLYLIMLQGGDTEAKTYTRDGEEKEKPNPILLDRRI